MLGPFAIASRRTPPVLHCHSPGVATVARRLRIDVRNNIDNNDNAWQRGPLWPHGMGPITCYFQAIWTCNRDVTIIGLLAMTNLNIFKVGEERAARWSRTSRLGRTVLLLNPASINTTINNSIHVTLTRVRITHFIWLHLNSSQLSSFHLNWFQLRVVWLVAVTVNWIVSCSLYSEQHLHEILTFVENRHKRYYC